MELSQLLGERTIEASFAGHVITVSYLLGERTAAANDNTNSLVADELERLVASWDLTDDGKPIPVTAEAMRVVPIPVLSAIYRAILMDDGLGEASGSSGVS